MNPQQPQPGQPQQPPQQPGGQPSYPPQQQPYAQSAPQYQQKSPQPQPNEQPFTPQYPPQQQPGGQYLQPLQYAPYRPPRQPSEPAPGTLKPLSMATPKKPKELHGPVSLLLNDWFRRHWKAVLLSLIGLCILGSVVYQIVYPSGRLLPGTSIDGVDVGGMRKEDAAKKLDGLYGEEEVKIFFGSASAAFLSPKLKEVGVKVVNESRVNDIAPPFFIRFIPGAFLFVNSMSKPGPLAYAYDNEKIQSYTLSKVGDTCEIPAKNATLKLVDSKLQVEPSSPGGVCDLANFQQELSKITPTAGGENKVRIATKDSPAPIDDDKARQLADKLNDRLKTPVPISVAGASQQISGRIVMSWLDFKADIPEKTVDQSANETAKLLYVINDDRFKDYMNGDISEKVTVKPGVTKISTRDFTELSRSDGKGGRVINLPAAKQSMVDYIEKKHEQAIAVTQDVGPTVVYTRDYTPTTTGFQALVAQFAQDNPGTYGIAVREISGVKDLRSGYYQADTKFPAAGIDSIYTAYAALTGVRNNSLLPAAPISNGRTVLDCVKDMLTIPDDKCRVGFYNQIGYNTMLARGADIGLKNTTFAERSGQTTANDLANTMEGMFKGVVAKENGIGRQIVSYGDNIRPNEGFPAGITSTKSVIHFASENDTMRNEVGVISTPKGVFVLAVMSKDSSWDRVAAIAAAIEKLEQKKIPVTR